MNTTTSTVTIPSNTTVDEPCESYVVVARDDAELAIWAQLPDRAVLLVRCDRASRAARTLEGALRGDSPGQRFSLSVRWRDLARYGSALYRRLYASRRHRLCA